MMKSIIANPEYTAIIGFLLALPFSIIFLLFILGFEPDIGPLASRLNIENSRAGSLIFFSAFLLLMAGFAINTASIVGGMKTGKELKNFGVNLMLSIVLFLVIAVVGSAIIVDQYPCWIGVPNCD